MPWSDWQFWVVTLAATWAGYVILRQIFPARGKDDAVVCGTCAAGAAACAKPEEEEVDAPVSELPVVSARR